MMKTREGGHPDLALHRQRASLQQAQKQARRQHRQRVQRGQQRHRDSAEAETCREALDQPQMHAQNLDASGESGKPSGNGHGHQLGPCQRQADIDCRLGTGPENAQAKAECGEPEQQMDEHHSRRGDKDADMQVRTGHELRHPRHPLEQGRLRKARAGFAH